MDEVDTPSEARRSQKVFTGLLVVLAVGALIAAGFRPKGEDAVTTAQRTFDDVDVAAILEGYEGQPPSQEILVSTAAFRAMCQRTMAALLSANDERGPAEEALGRMSDTARERLAQPGQVASNLKDEQMATVFGLLSDSVARGEVAPAADFVATQCDSRGAYLDADSKDEVRSMATEGAFTDLISEVTDRPAIEGPGTPTEPAEPAGR